MNILGVIKTAVKVGKEFAPYAGTVTTVAQAVAGGLKNIKKHSALEDHQQITKTLAVVIDSVDISPELTNLLSLLPEAIQKDLNDKSKVSVKTLREVQAFLDDQKKQIDIIIHKLIESGESVDAAIDD